MNLSERMKTYESSSRTILPHRMPVIVRVDGKAFHTWTNDLKPFDVNFISAMNQTAVVLCDEIQGAVYAYVQSDEISVLVHGYKKFESTPWFGNQLQKIVSVAASVASATLTIEAFEFRRRFKPAFFDARAFVIPENDVCNYFLWRQQDAIRNSIQSHARTIFSHKQCNKKTGQQLKEMCSQAGSPWEDLSLDKRIGRVAEAKPRYTYVGGEDGKPRMGIPSDRLHWTVEVAPSFNEESARYHIKSLLESQQ